MRNLQNLRIETLERREVFSAGPLSQSATAQDISAESQDPGPDRPSQIAVGRQASDLAQVSDIAWHDHRGDSLSRGDSVNQAGDNLTGTGSPGELAPITSKADGYQGRTGERLHGHTEAHVKSSPVEPNLSQQGFDRGYLAPHLVDHVWSAPAKDPA